MMLNSSNLEKCKLKLQRSTTSYPLNGYNQSVPKDIEKLEPLNTADESAQWYDHSEISLAVFHKFTIQLDNAT